MTLFNGTPLYAVGREVVRRAPTKVLARPSLEGVRVGAAGWRGGGAIITKQLHRYAALGFRLYGF